jgi:hypothetical protein
MWEIQCTKIYTYVRNPNAIIHSPQELVWQKTYPNINCHTLILNPNNTYSTMECNGEHKSSARASRVWAFFEDNSKIVRRGGWFDLSAQGRAIKALQLSNQKLHQVIEKLLIVVRSKEIRL